MLNSQIKSERLLLRPLKLSDASRIQELANNPNISKMTRSVPYPYNESMAVKWIAATLQMAKSKTCLALAVYSVNEKNIIGTVGIAEIKNSEAVLGYWIGERYWGQGYCTEAVKSLLDYAFATLGLNKITAEHISSNAASGKVMRKAGMTHIGTVNKECRVGEVEDIEMYEIKSANT